MNIRLAIVAVTAVAAAGLVLAMDPREPQVAVPASVRGPASQQNITVSATGTARAPISHFQLKTEIRAHAEAADEATENYKQTRLRILTALEDAQLEGVEVLASGLEYEYMPKPDAAQNQVFIQNRSGEEQPEPGVTCIEPLELRFLPAADELAQRAHIAEAIDRAVELGLKLKTKASTNPYYYNPNDRTPREGAVEGKLSEEASAQLERDAMAAAMERARALASDLAAASGGKVGDVNGVSLSALTTDWKGIGEGMEATATLSVSFQLVQ